MEVVREMTIYQAGEGMTIQGMAVYNIGFNGNDETQLEATGMKDLEMAWRGFCMENGIREDAVDYIEMEE